MKQNLLIKLVVLFSMIVVVLCSCHKRCDPVVNDFGVLELTAYDSSIFYGVYQPGQQLRFLRNKTDTLILKAIDHFNSEDKTVLLRNPCVECPCSPKNFYRLENYILEFTSPSATNSFFFRIQSNANRLDFDNFPKNASDTFSFLSFGYSPCCNSIEFDPDAVGRNTDSMNNVVINGKTYDRVDVFESHNSFYAIKSVYFHAVQGIVRFSLFKVKGGNKEEGDVYELIP